MNNIIIKLDRLSAWVLFVSLILYFITGYGMTKGLINQDFAAKVHLSYLTYIILTAFVIHSSFAIHLALKRWKLWNNAGKLLLTFFYLFFIGSFVYIDRFYIQNSGLTNNSSKEDVKQSPTVSESITQSASPKPITSNTTDSVNKFTTDELAKYNGENGNSAYVAVDGDVYDLTTIFKQGKHFSHYAGQELTNSFYSYHAKKALSKYPIVGKMA
jgi:predicted heme/steroid binding protein